MVKLQNGRRMGWVGKKSRENYSCESGEPIAASWHMPWCCAFSFVRLRTRCDDQEHFLHHIGIGMFMIMAQAAGIFELDITALQSRMSFAVLLVDFAHVLTPT